MKLKLAHLAGYLPYGLKVRVHDYKCDYVGREFDEVIGFHQWDKSGSLWSVLTCGGAKPNVEKVSPILRPLSDITRKELELEGFESHIDYLTYENKGSDWTLKAPFNMVQYLLSKHFDIFGLIEKGLAIDINNLDK
jgi:hypothetical protein